MLAHIYIYTFEHINIQIDKSIELRFALDRGYIFGEQQKNISVPFQPPSVDFPEA